MVSLAERQERFILCRRQRQIRDRLAEIEAGLDLASRLEEGGHPRAKGVDTLLVLVATMPRAEAEAARLKKELNEIECELGGEV